MNVGGSSKMLAIATPPSKKVVSNPNLIDQQAPKNGFEGATYVVLQPWASPINKKLLNRLSLRSPTKNPIGEGVEILTTIQMRILQRLLGRLILQYRSFDWPKK